MPKFERLKTHYERAKEFYLRYERYLMPATLVFGFIVDYITFTNININIAFSILAAYWLFAGLTIIFIHLYDGEKITHKMKYIRLFSPLLLQFFFGALLGGSFIFYWFSGSFSASWPFILILVILMISNDVFRHYFLKPILQIGVYFFVSLSLFSVILPFLFNSLSPWLFIGAGVISTTVIYGYITLLSKISESIQEKKQSIWYAVISVLIIMNLLYFTAIIPPIPLSVREAGVYHSIERSGSTYVLIGEKENFIERLIPGQTTHQQQGERTYVYSAIFAPADLNTTIVHHWEYYDRGEKRWMSSDKLSFQISGGRNEGYRGYTWKSNLTPGTWRVGIETQRGQVLARIKFKIQKVDEQPKLYEVRR